MKIKKPNKAHWSVRWSNPYTEPPPGWPRELYVIEVWWGGVYPSDCPEEIDRVIAASPKGYGSAWNFINLRPRRRWSEEAKKRNRRRRLERRLRKKVPLFADLFLSEVPQ